MKKIKWPSVEELNSINLEYFLQKIPSSDGFKIYYDMPASSEHYRLFTWLSNNFSYCEIVEIGVYKGFSGLALSSNSNNKVVGFDIINNINCILPSNYNLIIDDYRNYTDVIKKAKIIFYDTVHDGILEKEFIEYIEKIDYSGMIIFDDIYLNQEMSKFWKLMTCTYPSLDLTRLGHATGTGVIWV